MSKKFHEKLPIVVITAVDHCMDKPSALSEELMEFKAIGVLFAETDNAWYLANWIFGDNLADDNNEGFLIIKTPGAKLKVVGYLEERLAPGSKKKTAKKRK
jgi:hypothetical protein